MREIEFRGRALEDEDFFNIKKDDWIFGNYSYDKLTDKYYIEDTAEEDIKTIEVSFATIGQYTGKTDENGTKIFEGDIVEFETNVNCLTNELKPYWKDCIEKQCVMGGGTWWVRKDQGVVQWNSKDGMWDLKVYNNGKYKRKSKLFTFRDSGYVVVGNIYDNPELLKVAD